MGRPVSTLAKCGPVRGARSNDRLEADGHRGDLDFTDGSFLLRGRPIPIDHSVCNFLARHGLARSQWPHHVTTRLSHTRAMAGLRTLGNRPILGTRADLLRWCLDRAGAQSALLQLTPGEARVAY